MVSMFQGLVWVANAGEQSSPLPSFPVQFGLQHLGNVGLGLYKAPPWRLWMMRVFPHEDGIAVSAPMPAAQIWVDHIIHAGNLRPDQGAFNPYLYNIHDIMGEARKKPGNLPLAWPLLQVVQYFQNKLVLIFQVLQNPQSSTRASECLPWRF
ncbi:MAG: hypothetical protein ABSC45_15175 [Desulfobaccales bacterium]|jgi:hypothetical protein